MNSLTFLWTFWLFLPLGILESKVLVYAPYLENFWASLTYYLVRRSSYQPSSAKNLCLRFPDSFRALAPETIIFCHLNIAQNLSLAGQTAVRCGRMGRKRKSRFFAPLWLGNWALDADGAGAASPQTVAVDDFGVTIVEVDAVFEQNFTEIRFAIALKCFSLRLYLDHSNSPQLDLC